jgi:hypothetical protein
MNCCTRACHQVSKRGFPAAALDMRPTQGVSAMPSGRGNMKRILVSLFAILFLVGCADSHQLIRHDSAAAGRLTAADSIYIAVSADGVYGPGLRGRLLYPMPRARTPARRKLLTLRHEPSRAHSRCRIYVCRLKPVCKKIGQSLALRAESIYAGLGRTLRKDCNCLLQLA